MNVSFNSDSARLARFLNCEAAKAVKYGGVPEAEALKFVTLNPAIQLGIQDRVGSLEAGKDADFAVWNGSPLSSTSLCEQAWVDGKLYFDRGRDRELQAKLLAERKALVDLAKAEKPAEKKGKRKQGVKDK